MKRRVFLQLSPAVLATKLGKAADDPMPMATLGKIGPAGVQVCRRRLPHGHQGRRKRDQDRFTAPSTSASTSSTARACITTAAATQIYGKALQGGLRQKVLLMSKSHIYDRASAMRLLEESLKAMQTDYLDLWQCHQVVSHKEVDQILAPERGAGGLRRSQETGQGCGTSDSPATRTQPYTSACWTPSTDGRPSSTR